MPSPSSKRATNRKRSSITELSFHGINTSCQMTKSVTHVSGTNRHLSLEPLTLLTQMVDGVLILAKIAVIPDWQTIGEHFESNSSARLALFRIHPV